MGRFDWGASMPVARALLERVVRLHSAERPEPATASGLEAFHFGLFLALRSGHHAVRRGDVPLPILAGGSALGDSTSSRLIGAEGNEGAAGMQEHHGEHHKAGLSRTITKEPR